MSRLRSPSHHRPRFHAGARGPLLHAALSDLGARVIKIERPGEGDDTRRGYAQMEAGRTDQGTYFIRINAGKSSLALDLSSTRRPGRSSSTWRASPTSWWRISSPEWSARTRLRLRRALGGEARSRVLLDLRLRPERPAALTAGVPSHHQRDVRHHAPRAPDRSRAAAPDICRPPTCWPAPTPSARSWPGALAAHADGSRRLPRRVDAGGMVAAEDINYGGHA